MTATAAPRTPGKPRRNRSDSLQKMLELEHIQKLERLQGHHTQPTPAHASHMAFHQVLSQQLNQGRSSQLPPKLSPFPTLHSPPQVKPLVPLQSRRRDTLPAKKPEPEKLPSAMKAIRRTTALPSLSISVPPPANTKTEIDRGLGQEEAADHKHKTVTFLDVDTQDEPTADDASSICNSPSWESFGQKKKKEKKNEIKMRKKEKEQADKLAEKEAKSVKKKLAAKLHKVSPATRPPSASRSLTSPLMFADERLRPASSQAFYEPPPPIRPNHARQRSDSVAMQLKAVLTGHKMQYQTNDEPGFLGGLKLEKERQAATGMLNKMANPQIAMLDQRSQSFGYEVKVSSGDFVPPSLPRSASDGPPAVEVNHQQGHNVRSKSHLSTMQVPTWSQPLISPTAPPVPDVGKLQQWKDRTTRHKIPGAVEGEETELDLVEPSVDFNQERGRRRESYVHQHRQQSKDRSINGFNDEVRVSSATSHYPPQASRQHQLRKNSSSSESSPVASNFPPRRGSLAAVDSLTDRQGQGDDFLITFRLPYTPPALDLEGSPRQASFDRSMSEQPPMIRNRLVSKEIPLPPERSASRETTPSSPASTPSTSIRSFKDAAKAAFQKVSPSSTSKPPVSSYFSRASRDTTMTPESASSSRYSSQENLSVPVQPVRPFAEPAGSSMPSRESSARPTDRSSMSSFEEPMSSPSPATTPDSSRPQSEKGLPSADGEMRRADNETVMITDDERSYRHSHKAMLAVSSPTGSNPRISLPPQIPPQMHESHLSELEALVTEKFGGRKASVADCESDSDASHACPTPLFTSALASPVTSTSISSPRESEHQVSQKENEEVPQVIEEVISVQRRPSLSKSRSSPDLAVDTSFLPKLKHQPLVPRPLIPPPPPRSSKRTSSPNNRKSSQPSLSGDVRNSMVALKAPANPSSYLEQARKSISGPSRSSRVSRASIVPPDGNVEPVAKMLVECCGCKFLHDMPSKVYECMAQPDGMVEDKRLGVSGVITTTVKCPWCAHGMTTRCCAGYAAVVYLKEKLH
ncbi:uncharacterized protein CTRU02_209778 [Colletotrichum truncatum]|uniref:Uncharacterized protein n=1 Tax=Colletotrichum truncatum TaxID=5467 RepID=A0ACC3YTI8_COLTU|nr:uncharacterized protein CTRU02_02351 [Colletotrichum truncatum]KAF6798377.1 hypothetical protein CTRU02_02351 [Colletotrichum truncatum]